MVYLLALVLLVAGNVATAAQQAGKEATKKPAVAYVPANEVAASLAKPGSRVVDTDKYSIMVFNRTSAGESELHEADTDIFYILEGTATFVTGGTIAGGKTTGPGEIRGAGIRDGQTHQLSKGDIITIPKGTPHWYSGVRGTVTYLIVKVH